MKYKILKKKSKSRDSDFSDNVSLQYCLKDVIMREEGVNRWCWYGSEKVVVDYTIT